MTGYDLSEKLSYVFKKFREYCTEKGMSPDDTDAIINKTTDQIRKFLSLPVEEQMRHQIVVQDLLKQNLKEYEISHSKES
jgi:hypothetical protein